MPMGIVTDEEFDNQLNNVTNIPPSKPPIVLPPTIDNGNSNKDEPNNESTTSIHTGPVLEGQLVGQDQLVGQGEVVGLKSRGRGIGNVEVPSTLRALIAGTAHIEGRSAALELANEFGISPSSVSAYTKGATSTASYDKPDESIINFVKARKNRITKKALRVMQTSLDQLTPDKIATARARDIAGIARDMSTIIGNMTESGDTVNNNGPTFVLYAPPVSGEEHFKTIQASE